MRKFKQKALSYLHVIRRVNTLLMANKRMKRLFIISFILSILTTQAWVVDAWFLSQLINKLTGQPSVFTNVSLVISVLVLLVIDLIPRTLRFISRRIDNQFKHYTQNDSQSQYWKAYTKYDVQDYDNPVLQDALSNASRSQDSLKEILYIQTSLAMSILTIIVAAVTLATMTWWYFIVVLLMVCPRIYFMKKRKVKAYQQEKRMNEMRRYRNVLEGYLSTKESSINGTRTHFLDRYESIRRKFNLLWFRNEQYQDRLLYLSDIWYYVLNAMLILLVAIQVGAGLYPIGILIMIFATIGRLHNELSSAGERLVNFEVSIRKAEDFFLVLDSTPAIVDAPNAQLLDNTKPPRIEFDNVHFKYPGTDQWILKGVSFVIEPGETLGLIAKNGEGKTTIGMLLLRFYDPQEGSIRINGIDLRLIKRSSLFTVAGALFQDFSLLNLSIKVAIQATKPDANCSDFQVWALLEKVGLKEYVQQLPNQLHQKVSRVFKDAVKLSGGQNQKLGLAGLLHHDPQLIILDEFTSALDPEAEQEIVEQYRKTIEHKTALIISHRYLSIKIVDRIIVLQDGVIIESGKKTELLALPDGVFTRLYKASQLALHPN